MKPKAWYWSNAYFLNCHTNLLVSGLLTCAVVVCVVGLPPVAVDAQEGFVVIVLVPVEGGDSGESALSVATYQAGGSGHHLPERQIVLEEGSYDLEQLPGAIPLVQLWRDIKAKQSWNKNRAFRYIIKHNSSFMLNTCEVVTWADHDEGSLWVVKSYSFFHVTDNWGTKGLDGHEFLPVNWAVQRIRNCMEKYGTLIESQSSNCIFPLW